MIYEGSLLDIKYYRVFIGVFYYLYNINNPFNFENLYQESLRFNFYNCKVRRKIINCRVS